MRTRTRAKSTEGNSTTISFRLDEELQAALAARSDVLGVSIHELARYYVMEMLDQGEERSALREAILAIHREVHLLRENMMISTKALLASAGQVSVEQAKKWTEEVFANK